MSSSSGSFWFSLSLSDCFILQKRQQNHQRYISSSSIGIINSSTGTSASPSSLSSLTSTKKQNRCNTLKNFKKKNCNSFRSVVFSRQTLPEPLTLIPVVVLTMMVTTQMIIILLTTHIIMSIPTKSVVAAASATTNNFCAFVATTKMITKSTTTTTIGRRTICSQTTLINTKSLKPYTVQPRRTLENNFQQQQQILPMSVFRPVYSTYGSSLPFISGTTSSSLFSSMLSTDNENEKEGSALNMSESINTTSPLTSSFSSQQRKPLPCGGTPFPNITDNTGTPMSRRTGGGGASSSITTRNYTNSSSPENSTPSGDSDTTTTLAIPPSSSEQKSATVTNKEQVLATGTPTVITPTVTGGSSAGGKSFDANSVLAIDPAIISIQTVHPDDVDNSAESNGISSEKPNGDTAAHGSSPTMQTNKKQAMELFLQQLPFVDMFRGSANYIANHRNTIAVYHIPGGLVDTDEYISNTVFRDLMNDVALTWLLGMKIVLVAGCRYQIQKRMGQLSLQSSNMSSSKVDAENYADSDASPDVDLDATGVIHPSNVLSHGLRVTDENTLRIVKEEAGYVRFEVERQLARSLRIQGGGSTPSSSSTSASSSSGVGTIQRSNTTSYSNSNFNNANGGGGGGGGGVDSSIIGGGARTPSTGYEGNVVSGNFYSAQPFGILDGVDYKYTGFVRRVEVEKIRRLHESRDICLLTSLGVSPSGEVFNVNSESLAATVAGALGASKVIYFTEQEMELRHKVHGNRIQSLRYGDARNLLKYHNISINSKGYVTMMNSDKITNNNNDNQNDNNKNNDNAHTSTTLQSGSNMPSDQKNELDMLFKIGWCTEAIALGVKRAHIISPKHGALLQELYTRDGSGTLISADLYEGIRRADFMDVSAIHELITPLIKMGTLIDRPKAQLEKDIDTYYVYTRDSSIVACGQLKKFENGYAEIGCLVVNKDFRSRGRGDAMLGYLERLCLLNNCTKIFVLSTQTMEWFIERGFKPGTVPDLPPSRQATYNHKRASKIYMKLIENDRDLDASELWWNR